MPTPTIEISFVEFDIKYMYVADKRKNLQVLTVIDVYPKWVLGQLRNADQIEPPSAEYIEPPSAEQTEPVLSELFW